MKVRDVVICSRKARDVKNITAYIDLKMWIIINFKIIIIPLIMDFSIEILTGDLNMLKEQVKERCLSL